MRHSHIILFCIIVTTLFIEATSLCFPPASCLPSSGSKLQERAPRKALKTHLSEHHETGDAKMQDSDGRQHLIKHGGADVVKRADDADEDDQLIYHIDYHGVTTHPAPTPKHPKP